MTPLAPSISAAPAPLAALPDPRKAELQKAELQKAGRQFEAIFVRQMLAAARQASLGDGLLSGPGLDTFRQMQDERMADIAAERGVFGIGKLIEAQLARQTAAQTGGGTDGL